MSINMEIAFGKKYERQVAEAFINKVYPGASLIENNRMSDTDFTIVDSRGTMIAQVEVKSRRIKSTDYDTTIVAARKHDAAIAIKKHFKVPTIIVIAFTDTIMSFNLTDIPEKIEFVGRRDRGGKGVDHCFYSHSKMTEHKDLVEKIEMPVNDKEIE